MKRIIAMLLAVCFGLTLLSGCSITTPPPTPGVWYCKELNLVIKVTKDESIQGRWYYAEDEYLNVSAHLDHGSGIFFYYNDEEGREVDVYNAWLSVWNNYESNQFTIRVHYRINLEDPTGRMIEVDEKHLFRRVESLDDLSYVVR